MLVKSFFHYWRENMKLDKWPYANHAIHTTQNAHFREDFFSLKEGEAGIEYYSELSCGKEIPDLILSEDEDDYIDNIQGIFHYIYNTASDLWLVCSYFAEKGKDFFVFYDCQDEDRNKHSWVVWLPNSKQHNVFQGGLNSGLRNI